MGILLLLLTCVLVGWLAQAKKGRTGALWGALTILPCAFLWVAVTIAGSSSSSAVSTAFDARFGPVASELLSDFVVCLLGGGFMALLVVTLPKHRGPD